MVLFYCSIAGRPHLDVIWYLNGRQVHDDVIHKILVNEYFNHALMITGASLNDCLSRTKGGEASFQVHLNVTERKQVIASKFVEHFPTYHFKEEEPLGVQSRAVGTPFPTHIWQKGGVPIVSGKNSTFIRT